MSAVIELFGYSSASEGKDWTEIVRQQYCPFIGKKCYKVRKSEPDISIGTCSVNYGKLQEPVIICPSRLLERRQIFTDCLHLLTTHQPGNELHIVSEVSVPGGSVDYFVVSANGGKVKDFVGVELQTLDTTGTVWPERQRLLKELDVPRNDDGENINKSFGMNWKMTAKTILVQLHHKVSTFEYVNKNLVLIVQDKLLAYMSREFNFGHMKNPAVIGDSMHMHAYSIERQQNQNFKLELQARLSTDTNGVSTCLGLQAEAKVEIGQIVTALEAKISPDNLFTPV